MNLDEALSAAVLGDKVRAADMAAGTFIDYHFNGWRINHASGASSGWHATERDKAARWEVYEPPAPVAAPAWPKAPQAAPKPVSEPKRRGRAGWQPPAEINDIDDVKKAGVDNVVDAIFVAPVKPNPWAALSQPKPATGGWDMSKVKRNG